LTFRKLVDSEFHLTFSSQNPTADQAVRAGVASHGWLLGQNNNILFNFLLFRIQLLMKLSVLKQRLVAGCSDRATIFLFTFASAQNPAADQVVRAGAASHGRLLGQSNFINIFFCSESSC
jgi:hypothetical protein